MSLLHSFALALFVSAATPGEALTFEQIKATVDNSTPPNCYRSYNAPLDIVFVIDRTSDKVKSMIPRITQIIDNLESEYPESRFGLSFYADFQCTDLNPRSTCSKLVQEGKEHSEPEGCYTHVHPLTHDTEAVKKAAQKMEVTGGLDMEAGVMALLMAATDNQHMWSSTKEADGERNRILFLISDDGTHCCNKTYGGRNPPLGDGSDRCSTSDNPTPEFVGEQMKFRGINLYLGLMKEGHGSTVDVFENWRKMASRMPIISAQSNLDTDSPKKIVEVFQHFMILVVYKHGLVPCKGSKVNPEGRFFSFGFHLGGGGGGLFGGGSSKPKKEKHKESKKEQKTEEPKKEEPQKPQADYSQQLQNQQQQIDFLSELLKRQQQQQEYRDQLQFGWAKLQKQQQEQETQRQGPPPTTKRPSPFYSRLYGGQGQKVQIWMADPNKRKVINDLTYEELVKEVEQARPPNCYSNHKAPLDIVFLADYSDPELKEIALNVVNIVDNLKEEYPGSRFGMNYYSDFSCLDWNSREDCIPLVRDGWSHMDPEGCYTFNTSLTNDVALIKRNVLEMGWVSSVNKEAGVAALMMTAADGKVGWEGSKDVHRNRIIFVITNDGTHCCDKNYGIKNKPRGDGSDTCEQMDNPKPEFVGRLLKEKNIKLFLALNNGAQDLDVFENWNEMCQRMGVTFTMANTEAESNDVLFKKFKEFILRMIYADGFVPCPSPPQPPKSQKVGTRSSAYYDNTIGKEDGRSNIKEVIDWSGSARKSFSDIETTLKNAKSPVCYRSATAPLDVVFVVDCSAQDVLNELPRLLELMDMMKKEYKGSRFGLAHYADFQCTDWNLGYTCRTLQTEGKAHGEPEGCYILDMPLALSVEFIKETADRIKLLGNQNAGSGMAALLLAAVDYRVSWPPGGSASRNKVMVVVTNDASHCCGKLYGTRQLPKGDGNDKCATMDNPTAEFTGEILGREGISVFLVLTNQRGSDQDTFQEWDKMMTKFGNSTPYGMANYGQENNGKIFQTFKNFMVRVAYEKGPIRCADTPKENAPKKVSKVYEEYSRKVKAPPPPPTSEADVLLKVPPKKKKQSDKDEQNYEDIVAALENARPPTCYRDATNPLDIVFVVDHSSKDVLVLAQKVLKVVENINLDFKGTKFGLTFFSDFMCSDWMVDTYCPAIIAKKWDHDDPEGCYTFKYPLGTPPDTIMTAPADMKILASINTEAGVAGVMMAASDPRVDWPFQQMPDRNRVIFVITDDGSNCCGKVFGTKKPPKADGKDKCNNMDNPTPEFVGKVLKEKGISLFLAGGNGGSATDTFENWSGMANRMNVTFDMANVDEDDTNEIMRKFRMFLNKIVYYGGTVPCALARPSARPSRKK